eukprot:CAMPEP_0202843168 /NCGR_PEP_ID=MMETSP1389-20130828/63470_1 /ASSEMBLY_ACC=CAM_ASM_000865 /TAXON_ID=302021 /ORGANISM="Rhodomonas sp., Strain CCMP768" /LENGTH=158 /DNA_ID=CAMNT_0049520267 /DNA_START=16 /DNA_END=492 /DNA_ORIENTATION=-
MTVREIKEELQALHVDFADCIERSDLSAKLRSARERIPSPTGNQGEGVAGLMSGLQGSFNVMTDSFANMMKNVTDRFDKMEDKLGDLESKREQLRDKLTTPSQTPLGRLNQLKASAGARDMGSRLSETRNQCQEERERVKAEVAKAQSAGNAVTSRPT